MKKSLTILATGDLHIGRRPTKLANDAQAQNCSCARMWDSIVDRAIAEHVDVVALSGDIVDHDNRFFEATGPLERGLRRLAEHRIHAYAVAGNHDYDVFPRIVRSLDPQFFHLLGAGGKWESAEFSRQGTVVARFHGWSFPASHHGTSPMADYPSAGDAGVPTIGLLHADLDVVGSPYAPVMRRELATTGATVWLLGHVHMPSFLGDGPGPPVLYPGSPQAMDPGEPGPHGPWILEIDGPHQAAARQLPMSRVVYDELKINLSGAKDLPDAESRIQNTIGEYLGALPRNEFLEHAVLRLRLLGETPLCAEMGSMIARLYDGFDRTVGDVTACIDRVVNDTQPEVDLATLAERHDPAGLLAQLLLQLKSGKLDETGQRLLQEAARRIREVHGHGAYFAVKSDTLPGQEEAKEHLLRTGMLLLSALRSQRAS